MRCRTFDNDELGIDPEDDEDEDFEEEEEEEEGEEDAAISV